MAYRGLVQPVSQEHIAQPLTAERLIDDSSNSLHITANATELVHTSISKFLDGMIRAIAEEIKATFENANLITEPRLYEIVDTELETQNIPESERLKIRSAVVGTLRELLTGSRTVVRIAELKEQKIIAGLIAIRSGSIDDGILYDECSAEEIIALLNELSDVEIQDLAKAYKKGFLSISSGGKDMDGVIRKNFPNRGRKWPMNEKNWNILLFTIKAIADKQATKAESTAITVSEVAPEITPPLESSTSNAASAAA